MTEKIAVLTVNPVDGFGLFQHLKSFLGNDIPYRVFMVSDTQEIKINSGITLFTDDVIANLKGHEDRFDALVFTYDDVVPILKDNAGRTYNVDLVEVIKVLGEKGRLIIGHCAAAMISNFIGITAGKRLAVHPLTKPVIQTGQATDGRSEIDGNFYIAQDEDTLWIMMPQLIETLRR